MNDTLTQAQPNYDSILALADLGLTLVESVNADPLLVDRLPHRLREQLECCTPHGRVS